MKAIAFHLQKGGVGKSTLSVATAWELAAAGHPTVLVDCDPQGNASSWLLETRLDPDLELADVLTGAAAADAAAIMVDDNLWCIPTFGLTPALRNYGKTGLAAEPFVIADMVHQLPFEYAILDMGPGLGNIETAALLATDEVVMTMTPEYWALDGLGTWAEAVRGIERGMRVEINYHRLVVNGLNRTIGQMQEVYEEAKKAARRVYTVSQDPAFRKAQAEHVPVQRLSHHEGMKPENRNEIRRLAKELANGAR